MSKEYPHPLIAREGWPFIAATVAAALVLSALQWWVLAVLAWLAVAFVVQFFRDPPRTAPTAPNAVLSPADGRIVKVERTRDPYVDRDALKISVFMNVFNVHSNRSPVDGQVVNAWYHAGRFFNASLDKASLENERSALHLRTLQMISSVSADKTNIMNFILPIEGVQIPKKEGQEAKPPPAKKAKEM